VGGFGERASVSVRAQRGVFRAHVLSGQKAWYRGKIRSVREVLGRAPLIVRVVGGCVVRA